MFFNLKAMLWENIFSCDYNSRCKQPAVEGAYSHTEKKQAGYNLFQNQQTNIN